ncbi:FACT complex subunit [Scheffersomyces spartinae]|uniref:FACT complex subunit POB3 n=1 Tax=Scheffersomyces spartinae TaxID=45513 RepID=A0A9P7VDF3_9ASCO|nr:FACT complex subunit [Scheffersomyces spartinae]KAG7195824.1 FACT complex subunit [Scheffersomyces spartinae]
MERTAVDFDKIYLNLSKLSGKMRIADIGLGWKASTGGNVGNNGKNTGKELFLLPKEDLLATLWSRGSRGYELRVQTRTRGVIMMDGFEVEDFNRLKQEMQRFFDLTLDHKEHSLRGWNWGKPDWARNELLFQVGNKPLFEIPYKEIGNTNLTGKNEVAIEFNLDSGKAGDELIEMRFYVPGTIENETKKKEEEDGETVKKEGGEGEEGEENEESKSTITTEEVGAATVFYENLRDKAEIGQVSGEAIVSFSDVLFLTPRGRYDIDMYPSSLRLRGKTYDYKIQYKQIERIFSIPKPDEAHHLIVLQIDPPLRQGQTKYPFLVLQFVSEEETEVELNVSDEVYESKYKEKLKKKYDSQTHLVMSHCFKGLTDRRLIVPGSFQSRFLQPGISCSLKASEGYLYPLDRCFLFVTKPTIYIPFSEISTVTMSRTGGGVGASRTFDLEISLRGSNQGHVFGSIDREEQETIEAYCESKGLRVRNEEKIAAAMMKKALAAEADDDEDVDMGSAGEDEAEDLDFQEGSDLDVAEEFDSNVSDTGSSDDDMSGDEKDEERPPKKKAKKD